ncbi:Tc toxin subunit A-related protein [Photorhabdus noenieputensis]|uniref:Tc toxin subunit A-related protein n=1 Tax=Photorhabdus noenieputensis TaxID=1208607 RepID=UPI001BD5F662|nr:hypothetical protein [Photorhabdus noenieputensis]
MVTVMQNKISFLSGISEQPLLDAGYQNVFDIASISRAAFVQPVPTLPVKEAYTVHRQARQRAENLKSLYRAWQLRQEPVIKGLAKLNVQSDVSVLKDSLVENIGGDKEARRDANGELIMDGSKPRYWNVMPLELDTAWDTTQLATTDPDVIAMADPIHYKLAIFLHALDLLIACGDSAYRQLERDTLVEAKMYYIQAQQLLGPRPDIHTTNTWPNPTLSEEASAIAIPTLLSSPKVMTFAAWLSTGDTADIGDGNFLPPYNNVLLSYWDKLELRLYNLRHNLSLDGQPLNLPLYATPVDSKTLQRQQAGGDGTGSSPAGGQGSVRGWRYPLLVERARSAVSLLTQFGNSLQTTLERQDNEKMTLLLQTQQQAILKQQHDIQQNNLKGLQHSLTALQASRDGASLRQKHYSDLINGGLSAAEIAGLTLRSTAMITNGVATGLLIAGGVANAVPNVFGLANGGSEKKRRLKRIAVTLPTLLGPYQDLEATLVMGAEIAALSHGVNDGGRFVTDFNDSRFLPFEGRDATTGTLALNIFHAGKEGSQHELVANLSDIIVHLNYIIRDA